MNTNTYRPAWKNTDEPDSDWRVDMAIRPMRVGDIEAFLDDQRRYFPNVLFKAVSA
jgi:hypothetical protein